MCSEWQGAPEKNLVQLHCKKRKKGVQTSRKKMSVNHVLTVDHQLLSINHQWLSGGGERSTEQHKPSICCRPGCSLIHSPKTACLKKKKKGGGARLPASKKKKKKKKGGGSWPTKSLTFEIHPSGTTLEDPHTNGLQGPKH